MLYARRDAGLSMNTFTLTLYDATHSQEFTDVVSWVAEDASGAFGIQARHARFMTTLVFGLSRFQTTTALYYLALPGGVAYFNQNQLRISTRHFLVDQDLERISDLLQQQLVREEQELHVTRQSLHRLEQAMLQRLWHLQPNAKWL